MDANVSWFPSDRWAGNVATPAKNLGTDDQSGTLDRESKTSGRIPQMDTNVAEASR